MTLSMPGGFEIKIVFANKGGAYDSFENPPIIVSSEEGEKDKTSFKQVPVEVMKKKRRFVWTEKREEAWKKCLEGKRKKQLEKAAALAAAAQIVEGSGEVPADTSNSESSTSMLDINEKQN